MAPSFNADVDAYDGSIDGLTPSATVNSSHSSVSESSSSLSSWLSVSSLGGSASGRSSASGDIKPVVPGQSQSANKPHKANDTAWEAIRALRCRDGNVGLSHFKLVRKLGSGDIGNVYLCKLRSPGLHLYAMKVVDREALAYRNKLHRAEMEKQILSTLDHPFLPTLYAHFDASHYSCLVMEFCPGGDLHSLRQRQHGKRFSLRSTRFYAAEVLLALEYLHMMGVIFRDLKPENVLVRADGHIMLSDFDLSLKCDVVPTLQKSNTTVSQRRGRDNMELQRSASATGTISSPCDRPACSIEPVISCFFPSSKKKNPGRTRSGDPRPELVAEPTQARSKSFVGTHEYLAPEVISGQGHGSAVDWYTFGIFVFELLYGSTPFRGTNNETTLVNIITQTLKFPEKPVRDLEAWDAARDLIKRLLVKDPRRRLGSSRGAADIKTHPFFKGINWALIRSRGPPEIPTSSVLLGPKGSSMARPVLQHPVELVPSRFEYF